MSVLGTHDAVDYTLLMKFRASVQQIPGGISITASGTIMESAKVFKSVEAKVSRNDVLVTVYARLALWNRQGSPDFSASTNVLLDPGEYEIWYASPRTEQMRLGSAVVPRR